MDAIVILPLAVSILIGGFPKRQSFGHSRVLRQKEDRQISDVVWRS